MKKIAIIGRGTAGALSLTHFFRWSNLEIDWYHDPNVKAQSVGEGSTVRVSSALYNNAGFTFDDLDEFDGTVKLGIFKQGWNTGKPFLHSFAPPGVGLHLNAVKLQDFIFRSFKDEPRINVIEKSVTPDDVDADYVLYCGGTPKDMSDYHMSEYVPVNSCYVTQCFWDLPTFNYTLTIARPYGWIFGIPLKNRCSIGYLFNKDFCTLDQVKEDVQNIFDEYKLTPSDTTNYLEFKNYYRQQNFNGRVSYNGNASFFLEPLEATSLDFADVVQRIAFDNMSGERTEDQANTMYNDTIREIEGMIMLHYVGGSPYKTAFWEYAQERAERCILREAKRSPVFNNFINTSRELQGQRYINSGRFEDHHTYGAWLGHSYYYNLTGMELYPVLDRLLKP